MTEAEWLSAPYDDDVLEFLQDERKVTPRKLRLFCCGLARRKIEWLRHPWGQELLTLAERCADGRTPITEMGQVHRHVLRRIMQGALPQITEDERRISNATK